MRDSMQPDANMSPKVTRAPLPGADSRETRSSSTAQTAIEIHRTFAYQKGAYELSALMISEDPNAQRQITHLRIIIDGSTWTDGEDDAWCYALSLFGPESEKLQHLTLVIEGDTLFTERTFWKANISESVLPTPAQEAIHERKLEAWKVERDQRVLKEELKRRHLDDDDDSENSPPGPKKVKLDEGRSNPKVSNVRSRAPPSSDKTIKIPSPYEPRGVTQGVTNTAHTQQTPTLARSNRPRKPSQHNTSDSNPRPDSRLRLQSPPSLQDTLKAPLKFRSPDEITTHSYARHFIAHLSKLRTPIPHPTLIGPLQLSLRWSILDILHPNWRKHPTLYTQGGLTAPGSTDYIPAVNRALQYQVDNVDGMTRMVRLLGSGDDGGKWMSEYEQVMGMPEKWIVPTGEWGRTVWGWDGRRVWKGPVPETQVRRDSNDGHEEEGKEAGEQGGTIGNGRGGGR